MEAWDNPQERRPMRSPPVQDSNITMYSMDDSTSTTNDAIGGHA
jgi:hypothetical protein